MLRKHPFFVALITAALLVGTAEFSQIPVFAHNPLPDPQSIGSDSQPTESAGSGATVFVLNGRGTGRNVSTDPMRTKIEIPLYSVMTGEQVGMSTHNFACTPAGYCDDIDNYYLPEGTITTRAKVSYGPDSQQPGTFLVATHPKAHKLDGTGAFAGRTGSIRVTGLADVSRMPAEVTLDEIYIITYK